MKRSRTCRNFQSISGSKRNKSCPTLGTLNSLFDASETRIGDTFTQIDQTFELPDGLRHENPSNENNDDDFPHFDDQNNVLDNYEPLEYFDLEASREIHDSRLIEKEPSAIQDKLNVHQTSKIYSRTNALFEKSEEWRKRSKDTAVKKLEYITRLLTIN
mmetsp:Transcript_33150/g.43656  ORF Transcript_33150/g.43656 Transcript_33150/m.43656 type:complete len:159 (-) Transcript_33150:480-956(-)